MAWRVNPNEREIQATPADMPGLSFAELTVPYHGLTGQTHTYSGSSTRVSPNMLSTSGPLPGSSPANFHRLNVSFLISLVQLNTHHTNFKTFERSQSPLNQLCKPVTG